MADQKPDTSHDMAMGWGILALVAFALFLLFWHYFQYQIKDAFRWLRYGEMWLVSWVVPDNYTVDWHGRPVNFRAAMDMFGRETAHQLDGNYHAVAGLVMEPLKWPLILILIWMAIWAYTKGPGTQFRRKLGLDGLINVQAKTFPVISPFRRFNPGKQKARAPGMPVPVKLPPFAEALGPEEWLAYNKVQVANSQINEHEAYIAFARQLGGRWRGAAKLAPYKRVLLAAFCLKAARKRHEADDMLGRLAMCWSEKKGLRLSRDRKLAREARHILNDKKLVGDTLAHCNKHAFETTALIRALMTAREEGGVLAPAQFVWLRAHDRNLWYPLNNLGRQAYHMEALGAMSHFKAERLTQRPIPKPKVDNAMISIADYIRSPRVRPIPQLEGAGSKRKTG